MSIRKVPYRDWKMMDREAFSGASDKSVLFENDEGDQAVVGPSEEFDGQLLDVYIVDADLRCLVAGMDEAVIIVERFLGD